MGPFLSRTRAFAGGSVRAYPEISLSDVALYRPRRSGAGEARRLSPYSLASMLRHVWYGDWAIGGEETTQALLRFADEVLAISSEHGFALPFALGNMARGWCLGAMGQPAEGVWLMEQALNKLP